MVDSCTGRHRPSVTNEFTNSIIIIIIIQKLSYFIVVAVVTFVITNMSTMIIIESETPNKIRFVGEW